jgi:hypothetical protein
MSSFPGGSITRAGGVARGSGNSLRPGEKAVPRCEPPASRFPSARAGVGQNPLGAGGQFRRRSSDPAAGDLDDRGSSWRGSGAVAESRSACLAASTRPSHKIQPTAALPSRPGRRAGPRTACVCPPFCEYSGFFTFTQHVPGPPRRWWRRAGAISGLRPRHRSGSVPYIRRRESPAATHAPPVFRVPARESRGDLTTRPRVWRFEAAVFSLLHARKTTCSQGPPDSSQLYGLGDLLLRLNSQFGVRILPVLSHQSGALNDHAARATGRIERYLHRSDPCHALARPRATKTSFLDAERLRLRGRPV